MKKKLILLSAFILSLIGISFYGGPVTWLFFLCVLTLPFILWIYIFAVTVSLRIYQKPDGRNMVCSRPSELYITLQNESFFSFSSLGIKFYSSFSSISDIEENVSYELPPKSKISMKTKLLCRYRGEYNVGIKQIIVRDFLGVFSFTYRIKEPLSVIVAPARLRLFDKYTEEEKPDADRENLIYKSIPDITLREYVQGDDIRFVNWKATAAAGKLMVRERSGEEMSGIAILMDPKRYSDKEEEYLPLENKAAECVLGLSFYYLEHNMPADICYYENGFKKHRITDTESFDALYEKLTSYSFRSENGLKDMIEGSGGFAGCRMIIAVMEKYDREIPAMISSYNGEGIPVKIYVIDDTEEEPGVYTDEIPVITLGAETVIGEGI